MKHLYFVRHGQSHMNVADVRSGHSDSALTKKGKEQAQQAGQQAVTEGLNFDLIMSSPLSRAKDTAIAIANAVDYPIEKIECSELLKERNFGQLEGKNIEEHLGITDDQYRDNEASLDHIPEIEKLKELHHRAKSLLQSLEDMPQETILIVSHSAFGRALMRVLQNLPYDTRLPQPKCAQIVKLI